MKTKSIVYSIMIVLLFIISGVCQKQNKVEKKLDALQEALQLTSEQTKALKQILVVQHEQDQKDRELYKENQEELRTARKSRNKETDKQIESILTEKQIELFKEYKKTRRSKKGEQNKSAEERKP